MIQEKYLTIEKDINNIFVFFFKQKTAYEMRISDWSSDVCSSDLLACRSWQFADHEKSKEQSSLDQLDACAVAVAGYAAHSAAQPPEPATEIGRASCRERVCQYV